MFTEGDDAHGGSRLKPGGNCDRLVDYIKEFIKYTILVRLRFGLFSDRFNERKPLEMDKAHRFGILKDL